MADTQSYYWRNRGQVLLKRRERRKLGDFNDYPEAKKAWRLNNIERVRATNRNHYLANIEKYKENAKRRAESIPDKISEYHRRYYIANKERALVRAREYRMNNPDKNALKGKVRRQRLHTGLKWSDWVDILSSFNYKCAYCGVSTKLTVDHIRPISLGGRNNPDNVVPACLSCNSSKNDTHILLWYPKHLKRILLGGSYHV